MRSASVGSPQTITPAAFGDTAVGSWCRVVLARVGTLIRGVTYHPRDLGSAESADHIPLLRANNVQNYGLDLSGDLVYVSRSRVDDSQILQQGELAIAMSSGSKAVVGKSAPLRVRWLGCVGAFCAIFRPDPRACDPEYIAYVFQTNGYRRHIEQAARGTNINNLTPGQVLSYEFDIPPPPEQRAIARVLRAGQDATEARRRELALERERKAALLEHLFTYGTRGEPTKVTAMGEMPESWSSVRFSDVIRVAQGQVDPRIEPYASMPHVGPEDIQPGAGTLRALKRAKDLHLISGKYLFTPDHVLYSKIRPYLKKVARPSFEGVCSADMYPLSPLTGRLERDFTAQMLLTERFTKQVTAAQDRTGIPKVNREQLGAVRIPLPPINEQREIAAILAGCDAKITALEREIALHDELFRALLEELMSGRLSVERLMEDADA